MNIAFIIANSAEPDEIQQTTKLLFQGFPVYKRLFPIIRLVQSSNVPGAKNANKSSRL